ncbi:hypothetical protein SRB17_39200 [Streptomyces sp. RB17]|uniref:VWA domain-containing protein n=1 Tax=Streptomyces sp. RB17 TaxID=2585197 RepID=UPI001296DCFC|nr:VWA domain-containing protein [Streptomyces sp. RB17]MQY35924.1 hypothetical protein [Streptomyces sp. RB17]
MGILTLLRNAFSRARKGRATEAEGADRLPAQPETLQPTAPAADPTVPEPRRSSPGEHDLVAAAFNNVKVPHPAEGEPDILPLERAEAKEEAEPEVTEPTEAQEQAEPEAEVREVVEAVSVTEETAVPSDETTAPQAADGEDAPQGPPAADDETRTDGPSGNTDAEGQAEANDAPAPTPEATAADDETRTDGAGGSDIPAEGEAEADKKSPATTLAKVKSRTPSLATAYKAATTTLKKTDLTGTRAKVYLVLDRSASMRPYYKDGSAQALADQTLALAAHLDPEATVHTVFFSTEIDGTTDLTLTPDHETKIDDVHAGLGRMGRTSYHAAVAAVLAHYDAYEKDATPATPALVVFQTDGAPDAKTPATQALTEAAQSHPAVFFSFVAFGEHDNKAFDYLRKVKSDNTSFFHAGPTPRELTDTELYEGVLAAWRP